MTDEGKDFPSSVVRVQVGFLGVVVYSLHFLQYLEDLFGLGSLLVLQEYGCKVHGELTLFHWILGELGPYVN